MTRRRVFAEDASAEDARLGRSAAERRGLMAGDPPLQDLACDRCGAPIRTTAVPGAALTCDCCGSTFLVPDRQPAKLQQGDPGGAAPPSSPQPPPDEPGRMHEVH